MLHVVEGEYIRELDEQGKRIVELLRRNPEKFNKWRRENAVDFIRLNYADLSGADLRRADLDGAFLNGANLEGANLCGKELRNVKMRWSRLRFANFNATKLIGVDLEGANITQGFFRKSKWDPETARVSNVTTDALERIGARIDEKLGAGERTNAQKSPDFAPEPVPEVMLEPIETPQPRPISIHWSPLDYSLKLPGLIKKESKAPEELSQQAISDEVRAMLGLEAAAPEPVISEPEPMSQGAISDEVRAMLGLSEPPSEKPEPMQEAEAPEPMSQGAISDEVRAMLGLTDAPAPTKTASKHNPEKSQSTEKLPSQEKTSELSQDQISDEVRKLLGI